MKFWKVLWLYHHLHKELILFKYGGNIYQSYSEKNKIESNYLPDKIKMLEKWDYKSYKNHYLIFLMKYNKSKLHGPQKNEKKIRNRFTWK